MDNKYLNKDSAQKLLNTRPYGMDVRDALKGLSERGFTIEGYNDGSKGSINEKSTLQKIGSDIKDNLTKRLDNVVGGVKEIKQAYNQETNNGIEDSKSAGIAAATMKIAQQPLNIAGQVAGGIWDIIGSVIKGGYEQIPEETRKNVEQKIQEKVGENLQQFLSTPDGQKLYGLIQKGGDVLENNPDMSRALGNTVEALTSVPVGRGAKVVGEAGADILKKTGKEIMTGINRMSDNIPNAGDVLKSSTKNTSENIMNRVARVNPTDANKFKTMTGETMGEYLTRTGNINAPDKILEKEAETFLKAKRVKSEALASLTGNYYDGAVADAVDLLKEKALATSGKNTKSPFSTRINILSKKLEKEGLTMGEIEEVKGLFEKEIKLGYNKTLNPEKVAQATNIDNALRRFQDKTAKELGFENLLDINKQIQTSKFIIDKLGAKVVSNDLLNGMSLTDWIMIAGANPTAVAGLLTKKIFSSKGVQAKIAKLLSKDINPTELKAIIGESKFLQLPAGKSLKVK